jgi:hypothetical protein
VGAAAVARTGARGSGQRARLRARRRAGSCAGASRRASGLGRSGAARWRLAGGEHDGEEAAKRREKNERRRIRLERKKTMRTKGFMRGSDPLDARSPDAVVIMTGRSGVASGHTPVSAWSDRTRPVWTDRTRSESGR